MSASTVRNTEKRGIAERIRYLTFPGIPLTLPVQLGFGIRVESYLTSFVECLIVLHWIQLLVIAFDSYLSIRELLSVERCTLKGLGLSRSHRLASLSDGFQGQRLNMAVRVS